MAALDPDHELRVAANRRARELSQRFDDLVPTAALREGFVFGGEQISFGSLFKAFTALDK